MNLDFLKTLVEIDSRTENIAGVNLVQDIVAENLKSLGFEIKFVSINQDKTGKLLLAQKTGRTKNAISFVCHADTVAGPSEKFNFKLDLYSNKAYGPGIGDNKGGVALLLGALKDYLEENENDYYSEEYKIQTQPKYHYEILENTCDLFSENEIKKMLPPLLLSYINAGAKVIGKPAFDQDFNCLDFLTILKLQDLRSSFKKRYFKNG